MMNTFAGAFTLLDRMQFGADPDNLAPADGLVHENSKLPEFNRQNGVLLTLILVLLFITACKATGEQSDPIVTPDTPITPDEIATLEAPDLSPEDQETLMVLACGFFNDIDEQFPFFPMVGADWDEHEGLFQPLHSIGERDHAVWLIQPDKESGITAPANGIDPDYMAFNLSANLQEQEGEAQYWCLMVADADTYEFQTSQNGDGEIVVKVKLNTWGEQTTIDDDGSVITQLVKLDATATLIQKGNNGSFKYFIQSPLDQDLIEVDLQKIIDLLTANPNKNEGRGLKSIMLHMQTSAQEFQPNGNPNEVEIRIILGKNGKSILLDPITSQIVQELKDAQIIQDVVNANDYQIAEGIYAIRLIENGKNSVPNYGNGATIFIFTLDNPYIENGDGRGYLFAGYDIAIAEAGIEEAPEEENPIDFFDWGFHQESGYITLIDKDGQIRAILTPTTIEEREGGARNTIWKSAPEWLAQNYPTHHIHNPETKTVETENGRQPIPQEFQGEVVELTYELIPDTEGELNLDNDDETGIGAETTSNQPRFIWKIWGERHDNGEKVLLAETNPDTGWWESRIALYTDFGFKEVEKDGEITYDPEIYAINVLTGKQESIPHFLPQFGLELGRIRTIEVRNASNNELLEEHRVSLPTLPGYSIKHQATQGIDVEITITDHNGNSATLFISENGESNGRWQLDNYLMQRLEADNFSMMMTANQQNGLAPPGIGSLEFKVDDQLFSNIGGKRASFGTGAGPDNFKAVIAMAVALREAPIGTLPSINNEEAIEALLAQPMQLKNFSALSLNGQILFWGTEEELENSQALSQEQKELATIMGEGLDLKDVNIKLIHTRDSTMRTSNSFMPLRLNLGTPMNNFDVYYDSDSNEIILILTSEGIPNNNWDDSYYITALMLAFLHMLMSSDHDYDPTTLYGTLNPKANREYIPIIRDKAGFKVPAFVMR